MITMMHISTINAATPKNTGFNRKVYSYVCYGYIAG